jgi:hypothetical protein
MNIIDVQDKLKDFSEQQLVREMQMPSGTAPQFLVLSEIQRRKRMRDDFAKREAAQQQTVAQEAVSAAGVPNSGIAGMSEAMAPKSTMAQNAVGSNMAQAMRSGGLAQFGQELSGKVSEGVEPFLDEVEGMAQERFGVDISGPSQTGLPEIAKIQPMYEIARPNPDMFLGRVPAFMQPGYRGPRPRIANRMMSSRGGKGGSRDLPYAFNEGGAVKMSRGGLFDAQGRPTEALLRALIAQESGGDPMARGSLDEVGISQIRPSTALMPGYGVTSMFPEIAANIGEGREYATAAEAYQANKDLIDAGLEDPERSTAFTSDYLTAMRSHFDDDDRALAAYNVGPGGAAKLEDPSQFGYVADVRSRLGDEPGVFDQIMTNLAGAADAVGEAIVPSAGAATLGQEMTEVKTPQEIFDQMQEDRESQSFSDQASRFFQYPLEMFGLPVDDDAPGAPNTLLGPAGRSILGLDPTRADIEESRVIEQPGDRAAYQQELKDQEADKATEASQMYQDYIARGIKSGIPPSQLDTPREYREKRTRPDSLDAPESQLDRQLLTPSLGNAPGMAGVVSEIQAQEAAADAITQMTEEGEDPAAATQAADQAYAAGQRMAEQPGDRAAYEASLRDSDDLGTASTAPATPPSSGGQTPPATGGAGSTGSSEEAGGLSGEIQRLQDSLEKNRDSDKWLALAQAGLALMSSKEPTLLGAAGEAGLSGLTAFREAQERYQEGVIDLINARSKLAKAKGTSGLDADEALSTAVKLEAEARQLDALDPARANLLRAQAQRLFAIGGLPVGGGGNVPDLSAPAS